MSGTCGKSATGKLSAATSVENTRFSVVQRPRVPLQGLRKSAAADWQVGNRARVIR